MLMFRIFDHSVEFLMLEIIPLMRAALAFACVQAMIGKFGTLPTLYVLVIVLVIVRSIPADLLRDPRIRH